MKICIIAPVVLPVAGKNQRYGGIESVISTVSEELVSMGHQVVLFASGDSNTRAKLVPLIPKSLGQGTSFGKEKEVNRKAYRLAVSQKPDIIWDHTIAAHAHHVHADKSQFIFKNEIELAQSDIFQTGDIPVVHTLHGPAKEHMIQVVEVLSKTGHYFVCISKDQAKRFAPYLAKEQFLGTVYNPVDLEFYKPAKNPKDDYFLWLGRFCMEKGPHIALEAARRLKVPLKMIGKMSEKHEIAYFNKFIKPKLDNKNEYLGMLSASKKRYYLKNARATLMTNLWAEPFGLVAAESMASGTPVVAPSLGSLTELVN